METKHRRDPVKAKTAKITETNNKHRPDPSAPWLPTNAELLAGDLPLKGNLDFKGASRAARAKTFSVFSEWAVCLFSGLVDKTRDTGVLCLQMFVGCSTSDWHGFY